MKIGRVVGFALVGACVAVGGALADAMDEPAFVLPQDVVCAATAFEHYMTSAARIDAGFRNGQAVVDGLNDAASYQPAQLEEGMIAYGAIAALQDDKFVAGVEKAAGRGDDRAAFAERLIGAPSLATRIEGADEATLRIEAALRAKAEPLVDAGKQVKAAAYSVQHQAWSKVTVANAQGRLAELKSLATVRAAPSADDDYAMMKAVAEMDAPDAITPTAYTAIEARALALAAESVLGRANGADRDRLSPLFSDADSAECLKMAKLNLYQCMAVAGPQYEDIFCMGEHGMAETGACVASAAHAAGASDAHAFSVASVAPRPAPLAVSYAQVSPHRSLRIDP